MSSAAMGERRSAINAVVNNRLNRLEVMKIMPTPGKDPSTTRHASSTKEILDRSSLGGPFVTSS
jgi:hypothetical protein